MYNIVMEGWQAIFADVESRLTNDTSANDRPAG
jgi:hypothetical protein